MRFKSVTGEVMNVYDDRIELTQEGVKGFLSKGLSGTKTYYYKDISSIQFKNCGWTNGFFEFTMAGGLDATGGAWSGWGNDNRFTFGAPTIGKAKAVAKEAEKINEYIQSKMKEAKSSTVHIANPQPLSAADEIKKYKELLDSEVITQEEFDTKKKQLLEL